MSMFTSFNISASGMTAQQLRSDIISQNIANSNTTRTSDGTPYVRKAVVFTEKTLTGATAIKGANSNGTSFASALRNASGGRPNHSGISRQPSGYPRFLAKPDYGWL